MKDIEHQIQSAYFSLLKRVEDLGWDIVLGLGGHIKPAPEAKWIHAIPNGGKRHIGVAVKMKREGVKKGVPDVFIPFARNGYNGLYIEFKTPQKHRLKNEGMTGKQVDFKQHCEKENYKHVVCSVAKTALMETYNYFYKGKTK